MQRSVNVPGLEEPPAMGVKEGDDRGQGSVVVVDDVGQVRHSLVAFIHWRRQSLGRGVGGVDDVYGTLPTTQRVSYKSAHHSHAPSRYAYSGSSLATHEVFSFSNDAITIILSPTNELDGPLSYGSPCP